MNWRDALAATRRDGDASVLVTIESVEGSAPRGAGARLLVTAHDVIDTIGGGALERAAIARARELFVQHAPDFLMERETWTLGRTLSQSGKGRATLSFAWTPACDFRLEVFGAGPVAQAIAGIVRQLPCRATFHDPRTSWLAQLATDEWRGAPSLPSPYVETAQTVGVPDIDLGTAPQVLEGSGRIIAAPLGADILSAVAACHPGSLFLVKTHSHELDLEICEAVMSRGDIGWLGLIASNSTATRVRSRLARQGFNERELARLHAPLGQHVKTGDSPMEVAVAVIGDVLAAREATRRTRSDSASGGVAPGQPVVADERVARARASGKLEVER